MGLLKCLVEKMEGFAWLKHVAGIASQMMFAL
jgi:hypothetical protein